MSHYDCTHCGHTMGIAFGLCKNCTPAEYFALQAKRAQLFCEAERAWDRKVAEERNKFIDAYLDDCDYSGVVAQMEQMEEEANNKTVK